MRYFWIFLFSLWSFNAYPATTVTRYVDPGAGGANNGTSWADAYTSLNAWNAAEAEDITAGGSDEVHICNCKTTSGADGTAVSMTGWTTDATHTITIQVATADRHDGTRGTGYRLVSAASQWVSMLGIQEEYVTVDGIAASTTHANATDGIETRASNITLKNCLTYDNTKAGMDVAGNYTGVLVENCMAYGNGEDGIASKHSSVYHCTSCANGGAGIKSWDWGTTNAKNCYAGGNTTDYEVQSANATLNTTTCHDSDGTADTTTAYTTGGGCGFTNVTAGSENLTIASVLSDLIGVGTGGVSTYDFEGETRDVSSPDIGADEYNLDSFILQDVTLEGVTLFSE